MTYRTITNRLPLLATLLIFPLLALLPGCPAGDDDDDDDTAPFETGQFEFTTHGVDDGCLNGAGESLYMPEGPSVPVVWDDLLELPSFDDLPKTYTIPLPAPINEMEITIDSDQADQFEISSEGLQGILFDEDNYANCIVSADVSAVFNVQTNDHVTGSITMVSSDFQGDTCPVFESDPCSMVLDVQADRQ